MLHSPQHVVVRWGDTAVAESARPRMLLETGLRVHWYLPRAGLKPDQPQPQPRRTSAS